MPTKPKPKAKGPGKERELVITRIFDAPREAVWKAWTVPEQVTRWWGPKGYTAPACTIDLRVGGRFLLCMRAPEGKDYWITGVYHKVVPLKKLVYTDCFADEHGIVVPATHYGMSPEIPMEMLVTVALEDLGGKTKMTLRHAGLPAGPDRTGARQGWSESFDKLEASMARASSETEFVTYRGKRQLVDPADLRMDSRGFRN